MQPVTTGVRRYDPATMFLHWATALLVVTQWVGAQTIDLFPGGPLRVDARSVHITVGVLLVAMVLVGMFLAWTRGDSIFNLVSIPAFDPGNRALAD